jgi:hypothetical protein
MGDYQNGFRDGRSVNDNIFALKIINEKIWEYNQSVQYLFIDFQKAYDSIQGGADKSLACPTSLCRRTESIVSLARGVCACAELQILSCYRG